MRLLNHKVSRQLLVLSSAMATFGVLCVSSPELLLAKAQDGDASAQPPTRAIYPFAGHSSGGPALGRPFHDGRVADWIRLAFTEYSGPKIRIAFAEFEDRSAAGPAAADADGPRASTRRGRFVSIKDRIAAALSRTDRFDVVAAATNAGPAAEYLISGSVQERIDSGAAAPEEAGPRRGRLATEVAMSLRVVDTQTRQVLFATTERSRVSLPSADPSTRDETRREHESASWRSATDACIDKSAYRLVGWFENRSWSGRVSAVDGDRVQINAGRRQGLSVGMTLSTLAREREIVDPETGLVLGSVTEQRGRLEIVDVSDETAVAEVVDDLADVESGDRVEWRPPRS